MNCIIEKKHTYIVLGFTLSMKRNAYNVYKNHHKHQDKTYDPNYCQAAIEWINICENQ